MLHFKNGSYIQLNNSLEPEPKKKEKECPHRYVETSSNTDFDGETYECDLCGHRYRLYYDEMR